MSTAETSHQLHRGTYLPVIDQQFRDAQQCLLPKLRMFVLDQMHHNLPNAKTFCNLLSTGVVPNELADVKASNSCDVLVLACREMDKTLHVTVVSTMGPWVIT